MRTSFFIAVILLTGCAPQDEWMGAAERYQCTESQMQKANAETLFCKKEADYSAAYCYSAAIMRNCEPRRPDKENPIPEQRKPRTE
jgi:hypothetical protein